MFDFFPKKMLPIFCVSRFLKVNTLTPEEEHDGGSRKYIIGSSYVYLERSRLFLLAILELSDYFNTSVIKKNTAWYFSKSVILSHAWVGKSWELSRGVPWQRHRRDSPNPRCLSEGSTFGWSFRDQNEVSLTSSQFVASRSGCIRCCCRRRNTVFRMFIFFNLHVINVKAGLPNR